MRSRWSQGGEAEGNAVEQRTCRTPNRESVSQGLARVRQTAKERKKERFSALLHHVTIGIASLEDKIVQRAVVEVLNAIYEEDFLGFRTDSGRGVVSMMRLMHWRLVLSPRR